MFILHDFNFFPIKIYLIKFINYFKIYNMRRLPGNLLPEDLQSPRRLPGIIFVKVHSVFLFGHKRLLVISLVFELVLHLIQIGVYFCV